MASTGKPARLSRRRSKRQRLDALQKANEIRARRSKLKKDLATGKKQIHKVVANPPDYYARAELLTVLLLAVPGSAPPASRGSCSKPKSANRNASAASPTDNAPN